MNLGDTVGKYKRRQSVLLALTASIFVTAGTCFGYYAVGHDIFGLSRTLVVDADLNPVELPSSISSGLYNETVATVTEQELTDAQARELGLWTSVNPDVCGIIKCEELNIYDPVVQATVDNKQWLRTNIYGEPDNAGAIFMDVRCNVDTTLLKLLHGHNMKNGSMFARLPELMELEDCSDAPEFVLLTKHGVATYKVFSVISVNSKEEALPIDFMNSFEETDELLEDLLARSLVPGGEILGHDVIVLNTCWYGKSGTEHNLHCIVCASRAE